MKKEIMIPIFLFAFYPLFTFSQNATAPDKKSPPNILFIFTDDLGYGDLGVFFQNQKRDANKRSEPWQLTPNLDKLAARGASLTDHYCNAPVCAPSRASLLLGVHQGHANVRDNQFDKALEDNHTLATVLRRAGYATSAIGKWGLQGKGDGPDWPAHPLKRGFDYYLGYIRHRDGHEHYPVEGIYRGKKEVYENYKNIAPELDKCFTIDLWTAAAKKWITDHKESGDSDKPFFMYLAYDTPHAVLELPTQAYPEGQGLKGGIQWLGKRGQMINTASGKVDSWTHPDYNEATYDDDENADTPEVAWPETYKRYATMNRRLDDAVGDLMQLLKDLQIDSNTMVVFSSDNGPSIESYLPKPFVDYEPTFFESFGPFDGIKRDLWEGGVRMPTLASWPGVIPENQVVDHPSIFSDWMATFCDVADIAPPARTDGISMMPSLTGNGKQEESLVYIEYFNPGRTPEFEQFEAGRRGAKRNQMQLIRFDDYVGVRYNIQSANDDFEIYNVRTDPKETTNLAGRKEMGTLQHQMKERVLQVRIPDTTATRPYDHELVSPVSNEKAVPGINWKSYEGNFLWVSSVSAMEATSKGNARFPDPGVLKSKAGMLYVEGYLDIPRDGDYTFFLNSGSNFLLRIHEAIVIDGDFGHQPGEERSGKIRLKAGLHPFRFYFNKNKGKKDLKFLWEGPGFSRQPVPGSIFYRD